MFFFGLYSYDYDQNSETLCYTSICCYIISKITYTPVEKIRIKMQQFGNAAAVETFQHFNFNMQIKLQSDPPK